MEHRLHFGNILMAKQKIKRSKPRNWLAVHAWNRKGGCMPNKKKTANKFACRKGAQHESR